MIVAAKSDSTYAKYNLIAASFIRQFENESGRTDLRDMDYEDRGVAAALWFLDGHGRWSKPYIRLLAASLTQWCENLGNAGLIPEQTASAVLGSLTNDRPRARSRDQHLDLREQTPSRRRPPAKAIKPTNLRRLVRIFQAKGDRMSLFIAGYLQLGSRIGWRPGEIFGSWIDGNYLCASAEKHTNGRALYGVCEVALHSYSAEIITKLGVWTSEKDAFIAQYGDRFRLQAAINKRLSRACKKIKIPAINLYTLRHFAIACMKKSGMTREAIATIVNHASAETATERYGKARTGTKRAKTMFRLDPWRLSLVRKRARGHRPLEVAKSTLH